MAVLNFKKSTLSAGLFLAMTSITTFAAHADQLADIKKAGVVKVATFDSNPPFGSVDAKTHDIVGYDVDFAKALAKTLGVKLQLVPTNPANQKNYLVNNIEWWADNQDEVEEAFQVWLAK